MKTKRGRKPIKLKQPEFKYFGVKAGTISEGLEKYAEVNKLAYRWLNMRKVKNSGGVAGDYWVPLKLTDTECDTMNIEGIVRDAEGYIRRGDLVLGSRKMVIHQEHRKWLDHENRKQAAAVGQYGKEEMEAVEAALDAGARERLPELMTDRWLSDCTLYGPPNRVLDGLEAWYAAGLRTPILVPSSAVGNQMKAFDELFALFARLG